jgi:hypothetical protein
VIAQAENSEALGSLLIRLLMLQGPSPVTLVLRCLCKRAHKLHKRSWRRHLKAAAPALFQQKVSGTLTARQLAAGGSANRQLDGFLQSVEAAARLEGISGALHACCRLQPRNAALQSGVCERAERDGELLNSSVDTTPARHFLRGELAAWLRGAAPQRLRCRACASPSHMYLSALTQSGAADRTVPDAAGPTRGRYHAGEDAVPAGAHAGAHSVAAPEAPEPACSVQADIGSQLPATQAHPLTPTDAALPLQADAQPARTDTLSALPSFLDWFDTWARAICAAKTAALSR